MDGGPTVVGLDTSAEAVARARALGVDARRVDWMDFRCGEPFDAVLFVRSLHHMADLDAAVAKTAECLRSGGRVIVEDFAFAEVDAPTAEWIRSVRSSKPSCAPSTSAPSSPSAGASWPRRLAGEPGRPGKPEPAGRRRSQRRSRRDDKRSRRLPGITPGRGRCPGT